MTRICLYSETFLRPKYPSPSPCPPKSAQVKVHSQLQFESKSKYPTLDLATDLALILLH